MIEKEHAFQTLQERSILHEDAAFRSDTKSDCIESQLFALQDVVYKDFNKKLTLSGKVCKWIFSY